MRGCFLSRAELTTVSKDAFLLACFQHAGFFIPQTFPLPAQIKVCALNALVLHFDASKSSTHDVVRQGIIPVHFSRTVHAESAHPEPGDSIHCFCDIPDETDAMQQKCGGSSS